LLLNNKLQENICNIADKGLVSFKTPNS
jgi:hypothetical protein